MPSGKRSVQGLPEADRVICAERLRRPFEMHPTEESMIAAAWSVVDHLTSGFRPRSTVDERILRAIELVRSRIDRPITQEEIAAAVFLSPSRFRHLFADETGMAFRPFVLWTRLHRALELYVRGESLTSAAIGSGFSDLAHLSRTFRRMFGTVPTNLEQDERLLSAAHHYST